MFSRGFFGFFCVLACFLVIFSSIQSLRNRRKQHTRAHSTTKIGERQNSWATGTLHVAGARPGSHRTACRWFDTSTLAGRLACPLVILSLATGSPVNRHISTHRTLDSNTGAPHLRLVLFMEEVRILGRMETLRVAQVTRVKEHQHKSLVQVCTHTNSTITPRAFVPATNHTVPFFKITHCFRTQTFVWHKENEKSNSN